MWFISYTFKFYFFTLCTQKFINFGSFMLEKISYFLLHNKKHVSCVSLLCNSEKGKIILYLKGIYFLIIIPVISLFSSLFKPWGSFPFFFLFFLSLPPFLPLSLFSFLLSLLFLISFFGNVYLHQQI